MKIDVNDLTRVLQKNESVLVRTDSLRSDMNVIHSYYKSSSPNNELIQEYLKNNDTVNVYELARIYISQFMNGIGDVDVEESDDPNFTKISLRHEFI